MVQAQAHPQSVDLRFEPQAGCRRRRQRGSRCPGSEEASGSAEQSREKQNVAPAPQATGYRGARGAGADGSRGVSEGESLRLDPGPQLTAPCAPERLREADGGPTFPGDCLVEVGSFRGRSGTKTFRNEGAVRRFPGRQNCGISAQARAATSPRPGVGAPPTTLCFPVEAGHCQREQPAACQESTQASAATV